jgi:hypothetical protein
LSAPLRAAEGSVRSFDAPSQFSFVSQPGHSFSHEREKGKEKESRRRREMEKLSLKEIPYDIIYDIKKARIWHLKMPKVITILVLIFKKGL